MFCYQHNLHSSQTHDGKLLQDISFATSIIYIVLKQPMKEGTDPIGFATSIIYIVLKHNYHAAS